MSEGRHELIPFAGQKLQVITYPGDATYLAIWPVCSNLGLDPNGEWERIRARFPKHYKVEGRGDDATLLLSHRRVAAWLNLIPLEAIQPRCRSLLRRYQEECDDVLDRHFRGLSSGLPAPLTPLDALATAVEHLQRQERAIVAADRKADRAIAKADAALAYGERTDGYFQVRAFWIIKGHNIDIDHATYIGSLVANWAKRRGHVPIRDKDRTFGFVNAWREEVLEQFYSECCLNGSPII